MMTLTPAHGRDYKSKAAVAADLNDKKDFVVAPSSTYVTGFELASVEVHAVQVRYGKLRKVAVFRNVDGEWRAT